MLRKLSSYYLCIIILAIFTQCSYPDQSRQRTVIIQDSIWKMDSTQGARFLYQLYQLEDSFSRSRDSTIMKYNDSVRRALIENKRR